MNNDKKTQFTQKAATYLCCFNDYCPRHTQCLRWEVGTYVAPATSIVNCVNPRYQKAIDGQCDQFRDNQPITMPVGMKNRFYHDMPAHTAQAIKAALIAQNCRATYYKYHRGDLPIVPDYLALIKRVCLKEGWQQPLQFDSEVTDVVW